jgi:two-component system OmpR family response regulator
VTPGRLNAAQSVVLVVEDDPPLRELYRSALVAAGYAVFAVEDGLDALRYVEARLPAAVVLDLGLPRLHGRDVQREFAAQGLTEQVPIVVVTGEDGPIDEDEFACVLRKPAPPHEVVEAVRRCLARKRG